MIKRVAVLLFIFIAQAYALAASIQFVSIGVNGLTCSQCTRSVEMSIRKLEFVDSVVMDLESTEGKIYLKSGSIPDYRRLAKAVTNAGFSVRFMKLIINTGNISIPKSGCFSIGQQRFQCIDSPEITSGSLVRLTLVGEEFMPKKQAQALNRKISSACYERPEYYVQYQAQ